MIESELKMGDAGKPCDDVIGPIVIQLVRLTEHHNKLVERIKKMEDTGCVRCPLLEEKLSGIETTLNKLNERKELSLGERFQRFFMPIVIIIGFIYAFAEFKTKSEILYKAVSEIEISQKEMTKLINKNTIDLEVLINK